MTPDTIGVDETAVGESVEETRQAQGEHLRRKPECNRT